MRIKILAILSVASLAFVACGGGGGGSSSNSDDGAGEAFFSTATQSQVDTLAPDPSSMGDKKVNSMVFEIDSWTATTEAELADFRDKCLMLQLRGIVVTNVVSSLSNANIPLLIGLYSNYFRTVLSYMNQGWAVIIEPKLLYDMWSVGTNGSEWDARVSTIGVGNEYSEKVQGLIEAYCDLAKEKDIRAVVSVQLDDQFFDTVPLDLAGHAVEAAKFLEYSGALNADYFGVDLDYSRAAWTSSKQDVLNFNELVATKLDLKSILWGIQTTDTSYWTTLAAAHQDPELLQNGVFGVVFEEYTYVKPSVGGTFPVKLSLTP